MWICMYVHGEQMCWCVCPLGWKAIGFVTDTFMTKVSGKKPCQVWQTWSWCAQISLYGTCWKQGAWLMARLQLPRLWVHRLDKVRPRFWGCSQPMTKHSREYLNRASRMPLMGTVALNLPVDGPGGTLSIRCFGLRRLLTNPSLPLSLLRWQNCILVWKHFLPNFTSSLFIWHRHSPPQ